MTSNLYELLEQDKEMFAKTNIFYYKRIMISGNLIDLEIKRREMKSEGRNVWIMKIIDVSPKGEETDHIVPNT